MVDLVAGMALEDAMLCAMFPLAGIDLSPVGLVTGEVAVGGLGVLSDVGLPPPEVVLPFFAKSSRLSLSSEDADLMLEGGIC